MAEPAQDPVYDENDERPITRPDLRVIEGGGTSSAPTGKLQDASVEHKSLSGDELRAAEAGSNHRQLRYSRGDAAESQALGHSLGKGFNPLDTFKGSPLQRLVGLLGRNKKKAAGGAVAGGIIGGGVFMFSIVQGPLQFVHLAQLLQQFHFSSNESFGDDRTSKVLLYSLAGKGAQNGRLGALGNFAANRWEKRLLEDHGLRPVYSEPNRRFVGFEIVNDNKAVSILGDVANEKGRSSRQVERSMGRGANINTAGEASGGRNSTLVNGNGDLLPNNSRFVDLRQVNFADRRAWVRTVTKATGTFNVSSSVASRLLIKRFGVSFHPMNKLKGKLDEAARKRIEDKRNKEISEGVKTGGVKPGQSDTDGDNKEDTTLPEDAETSEQTKNYIEEFKKTGVFKTTSSATVIIGVLCAAKGFGDGVEDYKYQNNVLPMTRLGMNTITQGNQVMSNDDFNLNNLGVSSQYLYDHEKKSSWAQAESILGEQGKTGGKPIPPEADLRNATDKPRLFDVIDGIPVLGTTCSVVEGFFNLPGIKQVSGVISDVAEQSLNAALALGKTSTDELMESALKAVSGRSVDPQAKGADFGNFANTGAFLAANDNALSMGGAPLKPAQVAELKSLNSQYEKQENLTKSFASRYLDVYVPSSFLGSMVSSMPLSLANLRMQFTDVLTLPLPKAAAATQYDYGVPKYGFSVEEMSSRRFENPYENAAVVEPKLDSLNEKYGECFGMRVTESGIESDEMGDESLNVFKKPAKCDPAKNDDPLYLRYRFYLADTTTATSLACYEGDGSACSTIGAGAAPGSSSVSGTETAGAEVDIANIKKPSVNVDCAPGTKDLGIQDGYTEGHKVKIRICAIPNISSSGEESNGGYGVAGANGKAVVNSRVSGAFYALAKEAIKAGVDVSAISSFRTMSHQQALCSGDGGCAGGDYTFVAKPGTSNHQLGVAIDFSHGSKGGSSSNCIDVGGKCTLKGDRTWEWLNKNAHGFGIKQYSAEFWHWSPLEN